MRGAAISDKALTQNSNGAVRQLVSSDQNSVGFLSLSLVDQTVKAVKLGGVDATEANIMNGSYSLARPFLFVCKSEPEGNAKEFIDFVLSPEGQQILKNEGLISYKDDKK